VGFGSGFDKGSEEERIWIWDSEKDLARVANGASSAS
jgi:hypothetical protein